MRAWDTPLSNADPSASSSYVEVPLSLGCGWPPRRTTRLPMLIVLLQAANRGHSVLSIFRHLGAIISIPHRRRGLTHNPRCSAWSKMLQDTWVLQECFRMQMVPEENVAWQPSGSRPRGHPAGGVASRRTGSGERRFSRWIRAWPRARWMKSEHSASACG
jgi:hypothetical protein